MGLKNLPPELEEHILAHLDGSTFSRAKTVCKRWHHLVDNVQKTTNFWFRRCMVEIQHKVLIDITGGAEILDTMLDQEKKSSSVEGCPRHWEYWRKVYCVWYRSRHIGTWQPVMEEMPHDGDALMLYQVNCLRIAGDAVLYGCSDGSIRCYNLFSKRCALMSRNVRLLRPEVKDMKLINSPVLGSDEESDTDQWSFSSDLFHSHYLISGGSDALVSLIDLSPNNWMREEIHASSYSSPIQSISLWRNQIVTASEDHTLNGHAVLEVTSGGKLKKVSSLHGHMEVPMCIAVWENKVLSGGYDQMLLRWTVDSSAQGHNDDCTMVWEFDSWIAKLIYRDTLIIVLTGDHILHVSIDDGACFSSWNVMEALGSTACVMSLWGNVFALGTAVGHVHLFYIEDDQDFLQLDLTQATSVVKTGYSNISALDFGDNGFGPCAVIATDTGRKLKVVHWVSTHLS
ncbi:uncharacterized protein LOC106174576 [Lingula anatina]|uniref:Uncharacterized protein LOC106174576 n=1 Tax=Lingula anatina TaxID=7574 RepID=A0A2R2MQT6_LINAN|nr:uncharacterized protein LOC106174576 [Lingula anatina]XP_023932524.1 uncharacterized protein LOC106174576 [Lingula anatina]|eukprot:XP_023932523.1 uncharacterized protein LOC106174576 [Lingula anatina]